MRRKRRRGCATGSSGAAKASTSSASPTPATPLPSRSSKGSAWKRPMSKPSRAALPASSISTGGRSMADTVIIHTDGACSGNPGPGGWGAILQFGQHRKELKGGAPLTTNNKMELTAAIEALNALTRPCKVEIHTDSQYVKNGVQGWIHGWKRNGWKTADKKPVKNVELWQALDEATRRHDISWHW